MEVVRKVLLSRTLVPEFLRRQIPANLKVFSTTATQRIEASKLTKENIPPNTGCPICSRGITFKMTDVLFLSQFMTPEGYMINRRKTGVCKKQQQRIFKFMHIARRNGLLPRIPPKDGGAHPEYGQKSKSMTRKTYKSVFP